MSFRTNIAASWAAHVVTLVVGFFLVPLVLQRMGEEGYGVWVFINAIAGYSGILYLGFGPTVCRYVSHHRARDEWDAVNAVVSSVVAVYLAAGTLVLLLAAGFAAAVPWLDRWGAISIREVQIAVLILGVNLAVGMVGSVYGGVLHAAQRFDLVSAVQGITAFVRLGLTIAFLQQQFGLLILSGIFLAVTLTENGLTGWLAHREVPSLSVRRRWVTRAVLTESFGFSMFTALRWVSVRMIYMTDTVVIGFVLGTRAIVPYYVGSRLVQMIHQPLEKIGDVVLPAAGAAHARNDHAEVQRLLARGMQMTLLLAGGFFIGAAYFGERLLQTWMGPDQTWPISTTVLLILLGAQLVAQPTMVLRQALTAVG
ncbi:MAG: oligosaccharide flippase family protein, partial [Planctomycetaceae bacterium]|nr:oligosaccharide flippase family protein [Planctomycetaceae bacterium]